MEKHHSDPSNWLDRPLTFLTHWNIEKIIIVVILLLAVFSRFYMLGERVMSHDEVNHVVPSYELFQGNGYRHDPVTHGPFQFHIVALSYFMFGDNDFSARIPVALFSIAAVAVVLFGFKRYLGRTGALIAGTLYLISPFLMFYGRYTRNEGFIELFAVLTLFAVLRYLDRGDSFSLYLLAIVTIFQFITKETAYIYTAQLLLFVGILFLEGVSGIPWPRPAARSRFIWLMGGALLSLAAALGFAVWHASLVNRAGEDAATFQLTAQFTAEVIALLAAIVLAVIAIVLLVRNLGWEGIRSQRSFDIMILIGSLILPLLAAFPINIVGWDPLDYGSPGILRTGIVLVIMFAISAGLGLWWKPRLWLVSAAIFWAVFIVFQTTFFTNGRGFFTGLVGGLGYWLSQQAEERGSQPLYYYALVQIPMYEYLAALATLAAVYLAARFRRFASVPGLSPAAPQPDEVHEGGLDEGQRTLHYNEESAEHPRRVPTLALLLFFSLTSLVAYSIAGEKMPWLTVHIALPLLLTGAWGLGFMVDRIQWHMVEKRSVWTSLLVFPILLISLFALLGGLLGPTPPFQGNTLDQLQATSSFLLAVVVFLFSAAVLIRLPRDGQILQIGFVVFFAFLALLTTRTAIMANYINYDNATEYLVDAHAARGPKDVMEQVEEISRRITGGKNIMVAYDNDALYPYWWYLRDYPNHRWYTDTPTRDLRDYPLIIAGDSTSGRMGPIVQNDYLEFEYMRLWWPNQDYFNLTGARIWNAISDPQMRKALFNIWFNRDYTLYAQLTDNSTLTLEDWQPSSRMRFFVRKDVAAQIWNYGVAPAVAVQPEIDPYLEGIGQINPEVLVGGPGHPVQLSEPRGVAVAPDGSVYIADSRNNRIVHITADGEYLNEWGIFGESTAESTAPGGAFREPWGVGVGPDGSVYVADTWNHRVQKFTSQGEFVTMWGYFGQAERPEAFWGPRDVAVDADGRVLVTDTGNKRIVVFDANGNFITQFGSAGFDLGQFDEPVGVALDLNGNVYVADTWNQRIQVLAPNQDGVSYIPMQEWPVTAWRGQSLVNKPYLAVDDAGNVFTTDPEGYRLLMFNSQGAFVQGWDQYVGDGGNLGLFIGVDVDAEGRVWLVDGSNHRVLRFSLP
jgi:predicted membrane-bound mannosyltransferase/DNA-binding beta-propeller fold protein YncE